jgi:hypothetical protein
VTSNTPEVSESWTKAYFEPLADVRSLRPITVPARTTAPERPAASTSAMRVAFRRFSRAAKLSSGCAER